MKGERKMIMKTIVKLELNANERKIVRDFYELLHNIAEQYEDFDKKKVASDFEYLGSKVYAAFTENDIMEP